MTLQKKKKKNWRNYDELKCYFVQNKTNRAFTLPSIQGPQFKKQTSTVLRIRLREVILLELSEAP